MHSATDSSDGPEPGRRGNGMAGGWRRARVLVVDDNRFDRSFVVDALREPAARSLIEEELVVETCEGGEAALEALAREPADLVVSDLTMPGLSGVKLLERIRREYPGTDFLFLTGNASLDSAVAALRMGAADYLCKPIRADELVLAVQRTLARRWLLRENGRLREALATAESCRTLLACLEPGEVFAVALDLLLSAMDRRRGIALFRRTATSISDGIVSRGIPGDRALPLRRHLVDEKPVSLDAYTGVKMSAAGPFHTALGRAGIECGRLVALPVRGETEVGVLWVFEDDRPVDESELGRARIVVGHAELSLRNAERYSRAKERAFLDDVTDLYNARYLHDATEHEIQRAARYGTQLSVLFLDLDRFKLVNDRHGHLVGSHALRQLGQVLLGCVRQVDTLARYGGDEFTILLVDTELETAVQIAERIRRTVESTIFEGGREGALRLTLSIGVATYPDHGCTREELLDLSDKAMYRAKSIGRNRVCTAAELST